MKKTLGSLMLWAGAFLAFVAVATRFWSVTGAPDGGASRFPLTLQALCAGFDFLSGQFIAALSLGLGLAGAGLGLLFSVTSSPKNGSFANDARAFGGSAAPDGNERFRPPVRPSAFDQPGRALPPGAAQDAFPSRPAPVPSARVDAFAALRRGQQPAPSAGEAPPFTAFSGAPRAPQPIGRAAPAPSQAWQTPAEAPARPPAWEEPIEENKAFPPFCQKAAAQAEEPAPRPAAYAKIKSTMGRHTGL